MAPTNDELIEYRRVSTDEQASHGVSLDAQSDRIAAWCRSEGLRIAYRFSDPGRSGGDLDRPGLRDALAVLEKGEAGGLVVAALDRLTRSIGDFEYLLSRYFSKGRRLHVIGDQVDLDSAAGRLVARLRIVVGQHELERAAERTAEAMQHKRRAGQRLGTIPYGKALGPDGKALVDDHFEQGMIALMRQHRADGQSFRAIADTLHSCGAPTRSGKTWRPSTVQQILARTDDAA